VTKEFDEYLKCGRLEYGFLRVRCESCHDEKLVAFSCKRRGFCPSCGARRMADSAALLVDEILPHQPMRQWVLSFPFALRLLFASNPRVMTGALATVYRAIATHLTRKAGFTKPMAQTGAVTLVQRFGSALNLNIHLTCMDALMSRAQEAHDCRDAGGRVTQEQLPRSDPYAVSGWCLHQWDQFTPAAVSKNQGANRRRSR
jgi:ribosomal protein S27E